MLAALVVSGVVGAGVFKRLLEARKQMAKMMKQLGKGKMPALTAQPGQNGPTRSATKKKKTKRKKRTRR